MSLAPTRPQKSNFDLLSCGFVSGILQSILFNPWDKALYLSIKLERPFLDLKNFEHPMKGIFQTLVQRAVSSGLYFPLEDIFRSQLDLHLGEKYEGHRSLHNLLSGTLAGLHLGLIMNPFVSVRYNYWGKTDVGHDTFSNVAKEMFARGGVRPFFVGIGATVSRDIIFGGTYAFLRHDIYSRYFPVAIIITNDPAVTALEKGESLKTIGPSSNHQDQSDVIVLTSHQERRIRFVINLFSACVATIISSPLNYIRNMHYATPPDTAPHSMHKTLSHLATEVSKKSSLRDRVVFMMARLTIGWGTARVALGMAFGSEFYYYCSQPHS